MASKSETRGIGEIGEANPPQTQSAGDVVRELWTTWNSETSHELRRLCVANLAFFATIAGANMTVLPLVLTCVEMNQCVGCIRQFFTKSFLGNDAAVLARASGEEPASPRHRAGVASMAWRTTR